MTAGQCRSRIVISLRRKMDIIMGKKIDILLCNHFDLTWRRCFLKPLYWQGKQWISYARIQEFYIKRCLAMSEKDGNFKFNVECAEVLNQFLETCPEEEVRIRELIEQGRLDLPFAGNNIVDSNLVQGESIIRNFLYGYRYLKRLGHDGGKMAYRRDSFGNSAQLPQILRGFGIDWVWALSYTEADAPVWAGLDGTRICCQEPPAFAESGSIDKYAPCPVCLGSGSRDGQECPECEGRGIDWKADRFQVNLPKLPEKMESYSLWTQRSEELIPPWEMLEWPQKMQKLCEKENQDSVRIRHITFSDLWEELQGQMRETLMNPDTPVLQSCELNPNNTGVYVSRIELKKKCREYEGRMYELEHLLVQAVGQGMAYPAKRLEKLWRKMLFLMFHDAVTGTIVDAAYEELMETGDWIARELESLWKETTGWLLKEQDGDFTVMNPGLTGWKGVLPVTLPKWKKPCSFWDMKGKVIPMLPWKKTSHGWKTKILLPEILPQTQFLLKGGPLQKECLADRTTSDAFFIENENYRVEADSNGITQILDKRTQRLFQETDGVRIHEIFLENDEGSPWTTLSADRRRMSLTDKTELTEVNKNALYEQLTFKIKSLNVNTVDGMELSWSVTLVKNAVQIDFVLDMEYWDTYNKRIRVAFPSGLQGRALYDIPYGMLERKNYESAVEKWDGACGDWPAVRWAGISSKQAGMAVINGGTPSYATERKDSGEILFLSLLRSPCIPTYLHEPRSYDMRGYDGMRDVGRHTFSYALYFCDGPLEKSDIVNTAEAFAVRPAFFSGELSLQEAPVLESDNVRISAYYPDGQGGRILRLCEYRGENGRAYLKKYGNGGVFLCNLKEEVRKELTPDEGSEVIKIKCRPFEILTLKLV